MPNNEPLVVTGYARSGRLPRRSRLQSGDPSLAQLQGQSHPQGDVDFGQIRKRPENPVDLIVVNGSEVVRHDYRVHQQSGLPAAPAGNPYKHSTGVAGARCVAGDHCHNGLRQSQAQTISLNHQCGTAFRSTQVRVGEQNEDDFTAAEVHRRQSFQDAPNPQRKKLSGGADRRLGTRRCLFHGDRLAGESQSKSQSPATPQPRPEARLNLPSHFGRRLRPISPYDNYLADLNARSRITNGKSELLSPISLPSGRGHEGQLRLHENLVLSCFGWFHPVKPRFSGREFSSLNEQRKGLR